MNSIIQLAPGIDKITEGSLYPHQSDGVAFLLSKKRAILADDMGLGKTRQAIVAMRQSAPAGCTMLWPACRIASDTSLASAGYRTKPSLWKPSGANSASARNGCARSNTGPSKNSGTQSAIMPASASPGGFSRAPEITPTEAAGP